MALTAKQKTFCEEYMQDLNATQAAIRAGYSKKTAGSVGFENLKKPEIGKYIAQLAQERSERTKVDSDYVLNRLAEIDEMDVLDILTDEGNVRSISEWPKVWRRTISGIDLTEIVSDGDDPTLAILKKIKWPDKIKNLELIGKHVDVMAFKERVEHEGDLSKLVPKINLTLSSGS